MTEKAILLSIAAAAARTADDMFEAKSNPHTCPNETAWTTYRCLGHALSAFAENLRKEAGKTT